MIYEATIDNLVMLLKTVGELNRDQLLRFFRNAHDSRNVDFYITQLCKDRVLDYDEARNRVRFHKAPKIKDVEISKRIQAFWIIASFGSENVREVALLEYPSQFIFITHDNEVYDLTVCLTRSDAQMAVRYRKSCMIEGMPDDINHIAIVNTIEEGEALSAYGFDSYCILDSTKAPHYYEWK